MLITKVRKQGGAAVVTLPADVLRQLDAGIGTEFSIAISQECIVLRPARVQRRRYSLDELLAGVTEEDMQALAQDSVVAREGAPVGRELI
ncbi:AbrB family transcriptional regulator [Acidithiobacillus sp. AMEEHan]|uniref:AbrB/MazE/SpoVT family DNA-binding domain-containing protein n=1 Tax=Acidithiobacillus sp. AMEEHan TaxID=2994951 RepID=UPI0027E52E3B|nr:AbrB family transcriptional regulator [Acidithiobacillus sp. AMEEHan]